MSEQTYDPPLNDASPRRRPRVKRTTARQRTIACAVVVISLGAMLIGGVLLSAPYTAPAALPVVAVIAAIGVCRAIGGPRAARWAGVVVGIVWLALTTWLPLLVVFAGPSTTVAWPAVVAGVAILLALGPLAGVALLVGSDLAWGGAPESNLQPVAMPGGLSMSDQQPIASIGRSRSRNGRVPSGRTVSGRWIAVFASLVMVAGAGIASVVLSQPPPVPPGCYTRASVGTGMEESYDWAPPPSDQPWVANKTGDCRYSPDVQSGGGGVEADGSFIGELILDPKGCIGWNTTGDTYKSYVFRRDFCPSASP